LSQNNVLSFLAPAGHHKLDDVLDIINIELLSSSKKYEFLILSKNCIERNHKLYFYVEYAKRD
jgi:hypothetical protein